MHRPTRPNPQLVYRFDPQLYRLYYDPGNYRNGAGRAVPNAKLSDREGSDLAAQSRSRERPESAQTRPFACVVAKGAYQCARAGARAQAENPDAAGGTSGLTDLLLKSKIIHEN
jgi:hypothetical protein